MLGRAFVRVRLCRPFTLVMRACVLSRETETALCAPMNYIKRGDEKSEKKK